MVFVRAARGGKAPEFLSDGGELHTRVVQEMRLVLHGTDDPPWVDQSGRMLLSAARNIANHSGLTKSDILVRQGEIQWFPWVGSRAFETLRAYARQAGIRHEADKLSISYRLDSITDFTAHLKTVAAFSQNAGELATFLAIKSVEKFDAFLPAELLDMANGHDRLNLSEARQAANQAIAIMGQNSEVQIENS